MLRQNSVGSFEAKTHFSQLIERAMHGEEIFITRRGKPVAKLVPADANHDLKSAQDAATRLRALAKEMQLGPFHWDEWKGYRDIGRAS
ncbi:MAG: type II toxin-antitoxin system prevent-host-death family antitoxin [Alphaproteobacteria bacterium]|jgi:prevent-host-death family protein|nr:type II toxin-antitoxin system prevent-host-death family antitoxin [Alphaproteobacteria bacterium]